MSSDTQTPFLTYYVRSLGERTRAEKASDKFGFDWIIYNLAIAQKMTPIRLPFLRGGPTELSTTKTENEYGVDFAFLSRDKKTLHVFVLKDEVLNNANWKAHSFVDDLQMAWTAKLNGPEFSLVETVQVTLAYNKDEDSAGVELFDRLVASLPNRLPKKRKLSLDRWNLTTLVDKVKKHLLTPALLPQRFFSPFSYVCAQFADFQHGSDEWESNVVRNWRHFLDQVLEKNPDERSIRLLSVALLILREHGKDNPTFETGYIDLIEWAMLAVWRATAKSKKKKVWFAVMQMWLGFYLDEVEKFYERHHGELATQHVLDEQLSFSYMQSAAGAVIAFWHLGRMGLLALAFHEFLPKGTPEEQRFRHERGNKVANWITAALNANPAAHRPLLDLHHIELYLVWRSLWQLRRTNDIFHWLLNLHRRLFVRRVGNNPLPFIEGTSNMKLVWEKLVRKTQPYDFCDSSSFLLLMVLELCFSLPKDQGDVLLKKFYQDIVLAVDDEGEPVNRREPINLMGWVPPEPWLDKLLSGSLRFEGESLSFTHEMDTRPPTAGTIRSNLEAFVAQTRSLRPLKFPAHLPRSVVVLACIKHQSPLPMDFWRGSVFPEPRSAPAPGPTKPKSSGRPSGNKAPKRTARPKRTKK